MSDQMTCADTHSIIFLPGLEVGPTPSASPGGPTNVPSGRGHAPASHSATPAADSDSTILATSGRSGSISSASYDLSQFLASRLRLVTGSRGSTLYRLTWRERATPSGRSIPALRGSARRISGSVCIGWPTPTANDATGSRYAYSRGDHNKKTLKLVGVALIVCHPTMPLGGWPTPTKSNGDGGQIARNTTTTGRREDGREITVSLNLVAHLMDSGETPSGSPAGTGKPGQLNPAHSRWLMGYPPEWDDCGVTAMQSIRGKRRRS